MQICSKDSTCSGLLKRLYVEVLAASLLCTFVAKHAVELNILEHHPAHDSDLFSSQIVGLEPRQSGLVHP